MNCSIKSIRSHVVVIGLTSILLTTAACSRQQPTVSDNDGNSYGTVTIAGKAWTTENLAVAHYRNGDPIPEIKDSLEWAKATTGAWCYNQNNADNGKTYGKLYNWYAVNDPRGLAPKGWHVATDAEWQAASAELGGDSESAGAMKADGLWKNNSAINAHPSGLNLLPSGARRDNDGYYLPPGEYGRFWSATESSPESAWGYSISYYDNALRRGKANHHIGFAVRCVKD